MVPSIKIWPGKEAQAVRSPGAQAWGSWACAAVCRLRVTDRGQLASGLEHRGEEVAQWEMDCGLHVAGNCGRKTRGGHL